MSYRATLTTILLVVTIGGPESAGGRSLEAGGDTAGERLIGQPVTLARHDLSDALAVMAARRRAREPPGRSDTAQVLSVLRPPDLAARRRLAEKGGDELLRAQRARRPVFSAVSTPQPLVSFDGLSTDISAPLVGGRFAPPDTVGAAGPDHYVQMINKVFAIYDKDGSICGSPGCIPAGGGPFSTRDAWDSFGGACETQNDGDPIVLYDHLADRWLISQFAITGGLSSSHQCIAVSQTGDPLGLYHRYDFELSPGTTRFDDYPKLGLWPDAYVLTVNEFNAAASVYHGAVVFAFERDEMVLGNAADAFRFGPLSCPPDANEGPCFFSLQPGHLEGPAPAAGTPAPVVMAFDDLVWGEADAPGPDGYRLWEMDVDWLTSSAGLTPLAQVDAAGFDADLCGFSSAGCVPQPTPGETLDDLGQFTMFRSQVRDWGSHLSLVVNHTVDADGRGLAGIRWAELRRSAGVWSLHQSGTHSPDAEHRWMGSIAMNGVGDIALGYSLSSASTYPSVVYTTREAADPPGLLPGGEVTLQAGAGAQVSTLNRWGDYSAMVADPADDCTFWYTQEYYQQQASFDFKTRVGAFAMPFRLGAAPTPIEYGSVAVPGFKIEMATLANLCGAGGSLQVTGWTLSDPSSFSIDAGTGTCGSATPTIPSDGDCTIGVTFTPAAEGVYDETLTIDSNAPQRMVALSGASCGVDDKDVSQTPPVESSVTHVACRTITAGPYAIDGDPGPAEIEFLAGETLVLQNGFSVAGGDSFVGRVDPRLVP